MYALSDSARRVVVGVLVCGAQSFAKGRVFETGHGGGTVGEEERVRACWVGATTGELAATKWWDGDGERWQVRDVTGPGRGKAGRSQRANQRHDASIT